MAASYNLSVVTPNGHVFEDTVESLSAPGELGSFGVLARHAPMVAAVQAGVLKIVARGETVFLALGQGIVEVRGSQVIVLADYADQADSVEEAKRRIESHLAAIQGTVP